MILAPIVYRAPRIRAWRAAGAALDGLALAARVFGPCADRPLRRMSTRWLLRGGGRRVLVVTIHRLRRLQSRATGRAS